jgi:hypothetical protein
VRVSWPVRHADRYLIVGTGVVTAMTGFCPRIRIDLGRAIQSVPEHYREVSLLRDIEELSIDETAGVLDLSRGMRQSPHSPRADVDPRISNARLMGRLIIKPEIETR